MTVRVLFFALARDLVGKDSIEIELAEGTSVGDLRRQLSATFPGIDTILERSMLAVNEKFANDDLLVPANAEVACIPPVSGG